MRLPGQLRSCKNATVVVLLFALMFSGCDNETPQLNQILNPRGRALTTMSALHFSKENAAAQSPDTVLNDQFELILLYHSPDWVDVKRRFRPRKTFGDYPVKEKFTGKLPSKLNFKTCSFGARYKTYSTEAAQRGARFAGHYAFAEMGCGAPCQIGTIVDLTNGNVYSCPEAICGYEYRVDSRILVVNPPDSNGLYTANLAYDCKPQQYLWTGNAFKRLE